MSLPSSAAGERSTGRYRQKREAILNAAAKLFDENGIKGTMLSEVASQVGLSTNSITYYFKKKEDLVFECLMHTVTTIEAITNAAAQEATPRERVIRFNREFMQMLAECAQGRYPGLMTFRDVGELDASYTKVIFTAYSDMFRRVRALLADGPIQTENRMALTVRTHLLLTLVQWARTWLASFSVASYERMAEYFSDILLNGLAAPDARWEPNALDQQLASVEVPESANHGFLAAAIGLVNEVGYSGASIDRISARLSVTKGSFYHHIPRKEDLFAECIRHTLVVVEGMQNTALQAQGTGLEKLGALMRALVAFHFSPQGPLLRISAWNELSNYTQFHDRVQPLRELTQTVTDFLATGMMDGTIRPTHQTVAALMVVGMITGATTLDKWVPGAENIDVEALYLQPFFYGICGEIG